LAAHRGVYIWEKRVVGWGLIRIMSGFRFVRKERALGPRERVREICSIYGPVFWQVRPKLSSRKPRRRTSPLPPLTIRPRAVNFKRSVELPSPALSILSKSAVIRDTGARPVLTATQAAERPSLFTLVRADVRSRTPEVTLRKFRTKTPVNLPPRIQTKSASKVSNWSFQDGSESKPSPWVDSFPMESGLSPLLLGDYERPL